MSTTTEQSSFALGRRAWARPWLLALVRLAAVLLTLQLSGSLSATLDVTGSCAAGEDAASDCESGDDHECPPACPSCHCSHRALTTRSPQIDVRLMPSEAPPQRAGFVPRVSFEPSSPDAGRLYRPPRSRAAS